MNEVAKEIKVDLSHQQFNSEAELIDEIHLAKKDKTDFIIFNPGAFTHTSIALRDALLAFQFHLLRFIYLMFSLGKILEKNHIFQISP